MRIIDLQISQNNSDESMRMPDYRLCDALQKAIDDAGIECQALELQERDGAYGVCGRDYNTNRVVYVPVTLDVRRQTFKVVKMLKKG